jgi:pSer/pThr/pTyr-binding forkhead associated (FHA) protein
MPTKLVISNLTGQYDQNEFVFDQETITIGRLSSNDLALSDDKRIVSNKHAKIERQGELFQLIDLNSKNFTYLNDRELKPSQAYPIRDGDQFRIGDFTIDFFVLEGHENEVDKPSEGEHVLNPYQDTLKELSDVLQRIYEQYEHEDPTKRDASLCQALKESFSTTEPSNAGAIISDVYSQQIQSLSSGSDDVEEELADILSMKLYEALAEVRRFREIVESRKQEIGDEITHEQSAVESTRIEDSYHSKHAEDSHGFSPVTRLTQVVDVLMESIVKLVKGPWQFRLEFLGQTIIQLPESFSIHTSTVEDLKRFLFDEEIFEEEMSKRLALLKEAANEAMLHQIAVLDGYRLSVDEGIHQFLRLIDPKTLEKELLKKTFTIGPIKIPYRYLPLLVKWKLLQSYQNKHREFIEEDRNIIEKRLFRPPFIRGYLATMDSARQDILDDEGIQDR